MAREQLFDDARAVAGRLRAASRVTVVTHIDADGIAAGSVASLALDRLGKPHSVRFAKKLDKELVSELKDGEPGLVWFTDLGSGNLDILGGLDAVIADHHVPSKARVAASKRDRGNILSYCDGGSEPPQVNPHLAGLDGARDLSGAGAAYLVARELDAKNRDLAALAVVGAIGDLQDTEALALPGTNREIMEDGRRTGVLAWQIDIRFFGRETRPIFKMLQYSSDPILPGLTGSEEACIEAVAELGIPLKVGEDWRAWADLDAAERRRLASHLMKHALKKGLGHRAARRMLGEVYILAKNKPGTELHDAKEFATLLNACGRHGKPEIGLAVCKGDRGEWLEKALQLLSGHRRSLVDALRHVESECGVAQMESIQYFNAGSAIPDTIVGTVAGMLLNSGSGGIEGGKPIFGLALEGDGKVKVSARGTRRLVDAGLDLSKVMNQAAKAVDGRGGGHNIAAGATIPPGREAEFLKLADDMVKGQLSGEKPASSQK